MREKLYNTIPMDILYDLYYNKNLSFRSIAKMFNCTWPVVDHAMQYYRFKPRENTFITKSRLGKTNIEIYGLLKANEISIKDSIKNTGKKLTINHKYKISQSNKGRIFSKDTKNKIRCALKGKPKSKEHAIKCKLNSLRYWSLEESKIRQSVKKLGIDFESWNGFSQPLVRRIRNSSKYKTWRNNIFCRDNWTCKMCGIVGGSLEVHHIEAFATILKLFNVTSFHSAMECQKLWNLDNGITYCIDCHSKVDKCRRIKS